MDQLLSDLHDGVLTLTLNQPDKLNALSDDMVRGLSEAVRNAERDASIRCLVITGTGRGFSSGADVSGMGEGHAPGDRLRTRFNPLVLRMRSLEKPILAAVNGVAAGAGLSLALACDMRFAAESARFVLAFVRIGLVPDAGCTFFLPRLVGHAKALELALTGDAISASEALSLGMVNGVVPDALGYTQELAARLAKGPPTAQALIKRGMSQSHELPLERVLEMEANYQSIAARTPDFAEGVAAFKEKRPANFSA